MQITNDQLDWDSEDMVAWRTFLGTRAGSRLLPKLLENIPQLLALGESNAILIRSGEVRGWIEAGRTLLALAVPPPEVKNPETTYPDLVDDSKWKDGQTLATP